MIDFNKMF